jgi:hypothetical protein
MRCLARGQAGGKRLHEMLVWFTWRWRGRRYKCDPNRRIRLGYGTLKRLYRRWKASGGNPAALALNYRAPVKVRPGLAVEFARVCVHSDVRSFTEAHGRLPRPVATWFAYRLSPGAAANVAAAGCRALCSPPAGGLPGAQGSDGGEQVCQEGHVSKHASRFSMSSEPSAEPPPAHVDPADANGCPEWQEDMGKLGFTVTFIQMLHSPALWANSGFEERLDGELTVFKLGQLDSVKWGNPATFFFYLHSARLAMGLQLIKTRLAVIELLPYVKIGYADTSDKCWRIFYPELWT